MLDVVRNSLAFHKVLGMLNDLFGAGGSSTHGWVAGSSSVSNPGPPFPFPQFGERGARVKTLLEADGVYGAKTLFLFISRIRSIFLRQ